MNDHYDAERHALARCEDQYLREPAWRTGDAEPCRECQDAAQEDGDLCRACAEVVAEHARDGAHLADLAARELPDDIDACTPAHVRAELARVARLRDTHGDHEAAEGAETRLAWYLLRRLAREGHPLALAAVEGEVTT